MALYPISLDSFGSLATRWPPEKTPSGYALVSKNVRLGSGTVRIRPGRVKLMETGDSYNVTSVSRIRVGSDLVLSIDAAGKIYIDG